MIKIFENFERNLKFKTYKLLLENEVFTHPADLRFRELKSSNLGSQAL